MQELFQTLGTYLRKARIEKGLSQREVADALGYSSPQFISNFERGLCSPPLVKLKVLIDLYRLNPQKVLGLILDQQKKHLEKNLLLKGKKQGKRVIERSSSRLH